MARIFRDEDADLTNLADRTVAVIGYGNQGRSQALNMRDSGLDVVVGGIRDASFEKAKEDGFAAMPISEAVRRADIICMLLPDEAQRDLFASDIAPELRPGHTLSFAHGYNVRFRHLDLPPDIDVVMVAPRMIGVAVRSLFVEGGGAPAFVAVEQNATGRAWDTTLALARAIGATRAGALVTTFAEETELDLFSEQAIWSTISRLMMLSFDVLTERGYQPEAVLLETYASGEPSLVMAKMAEVGLFRQMELHSRTSRFGTLSRGPHVLPDLFKDVLGRVIDEIRDGTFAKEWERDYSSGYTAFDRLVETAMEHPINDSEDALRIQLHSSEISDSSI